MHLRFYCHRLAATAFVFMFSGIACSACAVSTPARSDNPSAARGATGFPLNITVAEAAKMQAQGAFILDVRQDWEWKWGHIPGSTLIPLGQLAGRVAEVPRDRDVVVVCRSGHRSAKGRDILLKAGFTRVTSMDGGVKQWETEGHPIVSGK